MKKKEKQRRKQRGEGDQEMRKRERKGKPDADGHRWEAGLPGDGEAACQYDVFIVLLTL